MTQDRKPKVQRKAGSGIWGRHAFFLLIMLIILITGCGQSSIGRNESGEDGEESLIKEAPATIGSGLEHISQEQFSYATELAIDHYQQDYHLVSVSDGRRYLVIPKEGEIPHDLPEDVICLKKPLENTYLAATAVMDMICGLGAEDHLRFASLKASDWSIEKAAGKMLSGDILYGGKYSMPDYELLVSENCSLAIENTMILHTPKVIEQLDSFGIPVLIDRATYEKHPLGRVEWIKLYGLLFDRQKEAESIFRRQEEDVLAASRDRGGTKKPSVVFFYITDNGTVSVRSGNDYIPAMIELAGGEYLFADLTDENSHRVSVQLQMETFYERARDADVLIYHDYTEKEITSLEELLEKAPVMKDFKAVKEKNVWCVQKDLYQQPLSTGEVITDFRRIFNKEGKPEYLFMLE